MLSSWPWPEDRWATSPADSADDSTTPPPLPLASEDAHAHMDRLKRYRWDDFDGAPVASLPFRCQRLRGMPLSRTFQMLMEGGLLTHLAPRPVPQPVPPRFRMDLHCSYHQGPGHDMNHCPSATMNPLPTHSMHAVPPPPGVGSQTSTPFILISDWVPFELIPTTSSATVRQGPSIVTRSGRVAQPPPLVARPFDGAVSHEESTQACISIWSLLASSRMSQIRMETITTLKRLIDDGRYGHMYCHRVSSVLLDNGSALNVCPLATTIALAYDSTKMEVLMIPTSFNLLLGRPWIHKVGAIPSSLHQKTLEVTDFCKDLVAMSFDQHSSMVVLDMMRGMSFMPGLGLGRRQHGPMEFVATVDHDTPFGLGFVPTEADYSLADYFATGPEVHPHMGDSSDVTDLERMDELHHQFHHLQFGDETSGAPVLVMIASSSPDQASFLSLCFPDKNTYYGVDFEPTGVTDGVVPLDGYRDEMDMSMSPIVEMVKLSRFTFDLFGIDSSDHDSDPIDKRVSPAIGDVETIDFGIENQPKELKIGSLLSIDERDRLIHLFRSYLDVFAYLHVKEEIQKQLSVWFISVVEADHLAALKRFFERIRKFRSRLNPKKCTFGVDPDKIKAILDMPVLRTEKEIRGFLGSQTSVETTEDEWLGFLSLGVKKAGNLSPVIQKLQETLFFIAFEKIKEYLLSPPVLVPPMPGHPLLLYLSLSDMDLGCMLAQLDDSRKKRAIYYLNPLRYLFDRPALTSGLMRCLILLIEFDIQYISQKSIKGSIVVDHLASLPISKDRPIDDNFPNEDFIAMTNLSGWHMYFDGAANHSRFGIGVLSVRLAFSDQHPAMNNIVEYEACILELLIRRFDDLRYTRLPQAQNQFVDVLATLASSVDIPTDVVIRPLLIESRFATAYCCLIGKIKARDDLPWYHDIYQLLRSGTYPEAATAKDRRAMRQLVHAGVCSPHMGGHMLARKIMRTNYFWLTIKIDCYQFVQRCPECQIHGDLIHAPPSDKISLKSSNGHEFILVAIDYFTKWVETTSYARLTSARVASFIRSHIICCYRVPHEFISDRGVHFRAEVDTLLQKYGIRHHRSSAYRPQTNGVVEVANKNIKKILRKVVKTS
ncbi:hypothetical protein AAG906_030800 [Vitis piasezkii]